MPPSHLMHMCVCVCVCTRMHLCNAISPYGVAVLALALWYRLASALELVLLANNNMGHHCICFTQYIQHTGSGAQYCPWLICYPSVLWPGGHTRMKRIPGQAMKVCRCVCACVRVCVV